MYLPHPGEKVWLFDRCCGLDWYQFCDDLVPFNDLDFLAFGQVGLNLFKCVTQVSNGGPLHVIHFSITRDSEIPILSQQFGVAGLENFISPVLPHPAQEIRFGPLHVIHSSITTIIRKNLLHFQRNPLGTRDSTCLS
jgi:hypothetical protein